MGISNRTVFKSGHSGQLKPSMRRIILRVKKPQHGKVVRRHDLVAEYNLRLQA